MVLLVPHSLLFPCQLAHGSFLVSATSSILFATLMFRVLTIWLVLMELGGSSCCIDVLKNQFTAKRVIFGRDVILIDCVHVLQMVLALLCPV